MKSRKQFEVAQRRAAAWAKARLAEEAANYAAQGYDGPTSDRLARERLAESQSAVIAEYREQHPDDAAALEHADRATREYSTRFTRTLDRFGIDAPDANDRAWSSALDAVLRGDYDEADRLALGALARRHGDQFFDKASEAEIQTAMLSAEPEPDSPFADMDIDELNKYMDANSPFNKKPATDHWVD